MSKSESKETPEEVAEGSEYPSNESEHTDSIWKTQLKPGQIRLFNIELDDRDDVRGSLEIFEYESAPNYFAQSYVCGEGACDNELTVNDTAHCVKPNLFAALCQTKRALLDWDSDPQVIWLWVDAICIHQRNPTELAMQIRFMENIYTGADSTFVSLGKWTESQTLISRVLMWLAFEFQIESLAPQGEPADEDSHSTDEDRARMIDIYRSRQSSQEWQVDPNVRAEDVRAIGDHLQAMSAIPRESDNIKSDLSPHALNHAHPFWQACIQLFEAEWFARLWTYQELMLSQSVSVTLQMCVPWCIVSCLRQAVHRLNLGTFDKGPEPGPETGRFHHFRTRDVGRRSLDRLDGGYGNIWLLLMLTSRKHARVAKDHVFAILSLLPDDIREQVDIDYSKTDAQVFEDILQVAIKGPAGCWNLVRLWEAFAWVPSTTSELPSWVPDFNHETDVPVFWLTTNSLIPRVVRDTYAGAAQLQVSPGSGLLFLKVLEIDVVSLLGGGACPTFDFREAVGYSVIEETVLWLNRLCCCLFDTRPSYSDDLPAMVRLRQFLVDVAKVPDMKVDCLIMMGESYNDLKQAAQALDATGELGRDAIGKLLADPRLETVGSAVRSLRWYFGGTYIFSTAGGRLGYSPKPVSTGDKICIVPGGNLLHVFSTVQHRYITCARIHGLMDERLLDVSGEVGREWEDIAIL
jgi:hypothetical protein